MKPTAVLSSEHRVIEVVLACLEQMSEQAIQTGRLDGEAAEQAIDFIRTFADGCHHAKEEHQLFTLLAERGMPRESGPIAQMLLEHDQGRAFVRSMTEHKAGAAAGDEHSLRGFLVAAGGYVDLLRAHIQKEDRVLFPMADRFLSAEDQALVADRFRQVESEHMGAGTHERYLKLAEALADRFGVARPAPVSGGCGCGH